jgi:CheY-specific phosphatase CheX
MPAQPHDSTVYDVTASTLESLALMFLVPDDEAPQPRPPCNNRVAVPFTGPFDGTLTVAVSDGVMSELAANMLGIELRAIDASGRLDALKELANVICGNLLPAIAGTKPVFHIGAPLEQPPACQTGELAGAASLCAEAGAIHVALYAAKPQTAAI